MTLNLRVPDGFSFALTGADAKKGANGRLAVSVPAGETVLTLAFDLSACIGSWKTDLPCAADAELGHYLMEFFEMPMHNKEMAGFMRKTPGVRVFRGPLLLAKGMLAGDCDREVFGEKGPLGDRYREEYVTLWNRQNLPGGVEASVREVFGK